jgi:chromosome segregation ATPase
MQFSGIPLFKVFGGLFLLHRYNKGFYIINPETEAMRGIFGKKARAAVKIERLSRVEHELKERMKKERSTLNVLDSMLKERDESLKLQEEKVIQLRKEYETRLSAIKAKEERLKKKEQEMKSLEKVNVDMLALKKALERDCDSLQNERAIAAEHAEKQKDLLIRLHKEEAHTHAEISRVKKVVDDMHKQFESAYARATKLTDMLRIKEHELRVVEEKLAQTHKKHHEISAQITHHSLKEIDACIKRAEDFIERGLIVKARQEYDKIRIFYANLTINEKQQQYKKITRIRDRLNYHF